MSDNPWDESRLRHKRHEVAGIRKCFGAPILKIDIQLRDVVVFFFIRWWEEKLLSNRDLLGHSALE